QSYVRAVHPRCPTSSSHHHRDLHSFPTRRSSDLDSKIDERKFRQVNRRELLKLTPIIALGAFAIPSLRKPPLKQGLGFSDWASADRKSTRLNSSHQIISYAVFCLKKKKQNKCANT